MKTLFTAALGLALTAFLATPSAAAADISGEWNWVNHTEGGDRPTTPVFQQNGENVTGKWDRADVKGTFVGDALKLSFPFTSAEGGLTGTLTIEGKLEGDLLKGKWIFDQYSGTFTATRKKTAAANMTGTWKCEIQTDRTLEAVLTIKDDCGKLSGMIKQNEREMALLTPKFENGVLTFQVERGSTTVDFQLKPDGDNLDGTWTDAGNSGPVKGKKPRSKPSPPIAFCIHPIAWSECATEPIFSVPSACVSATAFT